MFGKKNPGMTEKDVLAALQGVKDPDLNRDLVDLGMIKDVKIGEKSITLSVNLTTPACPMKAKIEADVRQALTSRIGNDWTFQINMTADVRGKGVQEKGDIPGVKNVIVVGSGKGGVGKSTIATSIAYGLQSYGSKVGLMDADVYGPSIPHLVGSTGRPGVSNERIQPIVTPDGLKLMSMGFLVEPDKAVVMRGPMLHGIVNQFLHQVSWGELDYLVIDLPPGTGDVPLSLVQSLPVTGAVVVCTPQEVALLDAVRAIAMFRQLKVPILGIVENMSFFDLAAYVGERGSARAKEALGEPGFFDRPGDERVYLFGRSGARRKAEEMGVPFLGEVPLNINIRERGDEGRLRDAYSLGSLSRPYLLGVVEQLAAQISIQNIKAPKFPKLEILG